MDSELHMSEDYGGRQLLITWVWGVLELGLWVCAVAVHMSLISEVLGIRVCSAFGVRGHFMFPAWSLAPM
ncbi:hypothetical protein J3E69DRAFT_242385 [Trichoderma sp. SZMC 28015]